MVNMLQWMVLTPLAMLFGAAILMPIVSSISKKVKVNKTVDGLAVIGFSAAFYSLYRLYIQISYSGPISVTLEQYLPVKGGVELYVDIFSIYMAMIFCGLGLLVSVYSIKYMEKDTGQDFYYLLLLTLVAGMIGVAFAGDFFNLFVFWELMCISSYTLVAFRKHRWEPIEAGFKYLIMSSVGSLMVLLGISLIYGLTGTVNFRLIYEALPPIIEGGSPLSMYMVVALIIAG